jgi:TonB family protein
VPEPSAATAQTTTPSQPAASSQSPAPSASAPTSGAAASAEAGRGSSSTDRSGPTQPGAPAAGSGFGTDGPGGAGRGGDQIASLPPGAGGVGAEAGSEYAAYLARLRQRIQEVLRYPPAARRRSVTGTVQLEIAIAPDGAISSVSVVASSSHEILDRAALDAARSLSRVPFPSDVRPRSLRVRLPVVFELQ